MKSSKINSEDTTLQIVTEEQADMQKQKRQDNKIPQCHTGLSFCYGQIHAAQLR